jgi:hypothetical protein
MTVEYIHAQKRDATLLRSLFSSGRRHFQAGIQRIVLSSLTQSEEISELIKNKDVIGKQIGGTARVNEIVRDIGLVLNGAIVVDVGEIRAEDVTQEISVTVRGDVCSRNALTFLPGAVIRKYKDVSGLWFVDALLSKEDVYLKKTVKYSMDNEEVDLIAKAFIGGDMSWIANAIKRSSREVDEHILSTIHYLQGRRGR